MIIKDNYKESQIQKKTTFLVVFFFIASVLQLKFIIMKPFFTYGLFQPSLFCLEIRNNNLFHSHHFFERAWSFVEFLPISRTNLPA